MMVLRAGRRTHTGMRDLHPGHGENVHLFSMRSPEFTSPSRASCNETQEETVRQCRHCTALPGFMSVRVNTKDPTLSVLFMSTGTFRLSSVNQM